MDPSTLGTFDFWETVPHGFMMPTSQVFVIRFWLLTKVNWQHPCGQPVALFSLTKGQSIALCDALQLALVAEEVPAQCWKALGGLFDAVADEAIVIAASFMSPTELNIHNPFRTF